MSDASYILQRKGFISMDTHKIAPKILGGGKAGEIHILIGVELLLLF